MDHGVLAGLIQTPEKNNPLAKIQQAIQLFVDETNHYLLYTDKLILQCLNTNNYKKCATCSTSSLSYL